MVTHVFDNSNLSKEIFAIDTRGAVICLGCFAGREIIGIQCIAVSYTQEL